MQKYSQMKNEIEGIGDVSETVKTMEKIAASHIHLLKNQVKNFEAYTSRIESALNRLLRYYSSRKNPLLAAPAGGEKALAVVSGDKGLVGGLYHALINALADKLPGYRRIYVVGAKGARYLEEEKIVISRSFSGFADLPDPAGVSEITEFMFGEFIRGGLRRLDIAYMHFVSLAEQAPVVTPFLPFDFSASFPAVAKESAAAGRDQADWPIFESGKEAIFDRLLEKYINIFFFKVIMEAKLSEFSARTVAMEHAAVKTEELISRQKLEYYKERRRSITQKQLEAFTVHKLACQEALAE